MSPTSTRPASTGATVTRSRLAISGTIDEPVGRKSTVAPADTRAAIASITPMALSVTCSTPSRPAVYRCGRSSAERLHHGEGVLVLPPPLDLAVGDGQYADEAGRRLLVRQQVRPGQVLLHHDGVRRNGC